MSESEGKTAPRLAARVVAIGASTGGPLAVAKALGALTPPVNLSILLVQHMAPKFLPSFVEWLAEHIALPVRAARPGDRPESGTVLVAPEDLHMRLDPSGGITLDSTAPLHSCRPAVDVLFASLAQYGRHDTVGVLLTGIGNDGAKGLLAMRQAGMQTIAQDEASSVIFGMPKTAAEMGAAARVLGIDQIARTLHALALGKAS